MMLSGRIRGNVLFWVLPMSKAYLRDLNEENAFQPKLNLKKGRHCSVGLEQSITTLNLLPWYALSLKARDMVQKVNASIAESDPV